MNFRAPLALTALIALCLTTNAQVPFATEPSWISTDLPNYSTGAAWADIDQDGWMDLVVSNGNDMARGRVVVYFNDRAGHLATTPGWQSGDIDYHGHVAVADINHDGYPEIAVSVYLGTAGFTEPGRVKLYANNHGALSTLPVWTSGDFMYTFSMAFGDANGDGFPDLAVACGEAYNNIPERQRIYFNHNGTLESLPSWKSAAACYGMDAAWSDIDRDGRLDLVFACEKGPNLMFRNYGDSIGTMPAWRSGDGALNANSLSIADIDNDGWPDLAVADNNQLGGSGRFKLYRNNAGALETTPSWTSASDGYGSGIALVDVNGDGWRDLVCGGWWEPCRVYLNTDGALPAAPNWRSSTATVIEAIVFADVDNDGLDTLTAQIPASDAGHAFALPRTQIQRVLGVREGAVDLDPATWCIDLDNGIISFATPPAQDVTVRYVVSRDLDMAISNWDEMLGNHIFINTTVSTATDRIDERPKGVLLHPAAPNPFTSGTRLTFELAERGPVTLRVYDARGVLLRTIAAPGECSKGVQGIAIDGAGLPAGLLFCALESRAGTAYTAVVKR